MGGFSNAAGLGFVDGGGMKSLITGLGKGGLIEQKAMLDAALRHAQAYNANMHGNVQSVKAQDALMSLQNRQGVDDLIAAQPEMPEYQKRLLLAHKLIGGDDILKYANAGTAFQKQNNIDGVIGGDLNAGAVGEGYDSVSGNYGVNKARAAQAFAAAGLSGERRRAIQQGGLVDGTDEEGNPITFQYGTAGKVNVVPGVKPLQKSGGADAAYTKYAAKVASEVEKDLMVAPEDKETEIAKRLERFVNVSKSAKNPKGDSEPKPDASKPAAKPQAAKPQPLVDRVMQSLGLVSPLGAAQSAMTQSDGPVKIKDAAEFNALPKGTKFYDPNGILRIK
jgi:hypothetical protein